MGAVGIYSPVSFSDTMTPPENEAFISHFRIIAVHSTEQRRREIPGRGHKRERRPKSKSLGPSIRVAIAGGGLTEAFLIHYLINISHLHKPNTSLRLPTNLKIQIH